MPFEPRLGDRLGPVEREPREVFEREHLEEVRERAEREKLSREATEKFESVKAEYEHGDAVERLERDPRVERTKHGCIRLQGQPREVRNTLRREAYRLRKMGWGYKIVARALDISRDTVSAWFYQLQPYMLAGE